MVKREKEVKALGFDKKIVRGRQTDIWATGVTLFQIATGSLPFTIKSVMDVKRQLDNNKPDYSSLENVDKEHEGFLCLLKKMLVMEYPPDARYTIEQLIKDEWLTKNGTEPIVLYVQEIDSGFVR